MEKNNFIFIENDNEPIETDFIYTLDDSKVVDRYGNAKRLLEENISFLQEDKRSCITAKDALNLMVALKNFCISVLDDLTVRKICGEPLKMTRLILLRNHLDLYVQKRIITESTAGLSNIN